MKDLSEFYKENEEWGGLEMKDGSYSDGYDTLVKSMEYEVLAQDSFGSYQGENVWVLRDGDKYGVLISGYGSCSGCDAYEASDNSLEDLTDLRDTMAQDIKWCTKDEFVARYSKSKEELIEAGVIPEYSYWEDGVEEFLTKQAKAIGKEKGVPNK